MKTILHLISFLVFLLFINIAQADNYMLFMGGGGEPAGDKTIFDNDIITLGKSLKNSNWKYKVAFDGGHKETENAISQSLPEDKDKLPFTSENYLKIINDYKNKIENGEIKSGDQLMVMLDTHGAANDSPGPNNLTHQVATVGGKAQNLNTLSGSTTVSLDNLQSLIDVANKKGVKLALVDLSCHSGNTLKLKNNKTCIISATGPVHFSYASNQSFTHYFLEGLNKNVNLEESFLKARLADPYPAYPEISTDSDEQIKNAIYKDITPYLYFFNKDFDKLMPNLDESTTSITQCKREEMFKDLKTKINALLAISKSAGTYSPEALFKRLDEYKATQDNLIELMKSNGAADLKTIEHFKSVVAVNSKIKVTDILDFSWEDIISSDPDSTIKYFKTVAAESHNSLDKNNALAIMENWKKVKLKKEQILKDSPKLADYKKQINLSKEQTDKIYQQAYFVGLEEHKLYNSLYQMDQMTHPETSNPCKEFVF